MVIGGGQGASGGAQVPSQLGIQVTTYTSSFSLLDFGGSSCLASVLFSTPSGAAFPFLARRRCGEAVSGGLLVWQRGRVS